MKDSDLLNFISSVEGLVGHAKFLERSFTKTKKDGLYSSDIVDMEELLLKLKNSMITKVHSEGASR